ncbi:hypothetical protein ACIBF1_21450 [Spirillospora sp. NPDC050679]
MPDEVPTMADDGSASRSDQAGRADQTPQLIWLAIVMGIAGLVFASGVLALGAKGEIIVGPLGIVVGLMIPVIERLIDAWLHRGPPQVPRRPKTWVIIMACAVLAGAVLVIYWFKADKADVNVTGHAVVMNGANLQNGASAQVRLPPSDGREWLALKLNVESLTQSGFCVAPAQLHVVAKADGVQKAQKAARAGEEIKLRLGQVEDQARLSVRLSVPDQQCRIRLGIDEAVFYNRGFS